MPDHKYFSNLIWQIADLLRGPYRPPQYERVMLPLTVLRRFDCVLAPTKEKVLAEYKRWEGKLDGEALDAKLNMAAGQRFHNHSPLDFEKLKGDPDNIAQHLNSYINGFSANVRQIFEYFEFGNEIEKMHEANILYLVVSQFCDVELHPDKVPNEQMGLIFENLIRRFNELANETAGDYFTPREIIRLMVNILFINDGKLLATPGTVRKLLDPACGTGGMLAEAQNYLREHHPEAKLYVYGQDYNKRAFATAASDMLIKQVNHNGGGNNILYGDIFIEDRFAGKTFDYFLTNPPFGVDWKKQQKEIQREIGRYTDGFVDVQMVSDTKAIVYIDDKDVPAAIGKGGKNVSGIVNKLGIGIDIKPRSEFDRQQTQKPAAEEEINLGGGIKIQTDKKQLTILAPSESGRIVDVFAGKEYLFTATVNEQGEIHLAKNSSIAQEMIRRFTNNENIKLRPV